MEREILHLRSKDARFGELAKLTVDELDDLEDYYQCVEYALNNACDSSYPHDACIKPHLYNNLTQSRTSSDEVASSALTSVPFFAS